MSLAFVFPGQGSQSVGMMGALGAALAGRSRRPSREASEVLGYDLWKRCQEGPAEALNATECTQPLMLTAGVATYRLWRERGGAVPALMAGHSLGEFSALVAAGCLDFKAAVELVKFRAEAMQAAVPPGQGAMAAILGLEDTDVEAACAEAAQGEVVEAVNFNAPGQVVIAGTRSGRRPRHRGGERARGARRAMALPISVPAHSSLMAPAAERLRERLESVAVAARRRASRSTGSMSRRTARPDEIRAARGQTIAYPGVLGRDGAHHDRGGRDRIVECGPGKVLTSLNRRVDKNRDLKMLALEDPQSLDEALASSTD